MKAFEALHIARTCGIADGVLPGLLLSKVPSVPLRLWWIWNHGFLDSLGRQGRRMGGGHRCLGWVDNVGCFEVVLKNFQSCLNHDSYLIPFFGCICTLDFCYHTINLSDYHIFFRLKWFETRCLHVCTLSIQVIERVSAYPALRVGRNWPRTMHWWSQAGLMRMFCTAWSGEVSDIWGIWVQNGSLVHRWRLLRNGMPFHLKSCPCWATLVAPTSLRTSGEHRQQAWLSRPITSTVPNKQWLHVAQEMSWMMQWLASLRLRRDARTNQGQKTIRVNTSSSCTRCSVWTISFHIFTFFIYRNANVGKTHWTARNSTIFRPNDFWSSSLSTSINSMWKSPTSFEEIQPTICWSFPPWRNQARALESGRWDPGLCANDASREGGEGGGSWWNWLDISN